MLTGVFAGLGPASASTPATCHPGPVTQPVSPASGLNQLDGVAVLSACNVWVAGFTDDDTVGRRTLIEHWNGSAWTVVPTPHPGGRSLLTSIRAISPVSIWAAGEFDDGPNPGLTDKPLILHYNGHTWTKVGTPSIDPAGDSGLNWVRPVTATDIWAVGSDFSNVHAPVTKAIILHSAGTAWQRSRLPKLAAPNSELFGVAGNSARDAWAVGDTFSKAILGPIHVSRAGAHSLGGDRHTLILRWNGTAWKPVKSPSPAPDSTLSAVGTVGPASAWAVGFTEARDGSGKALALRWNGHAWTTVPTPAGPRGALRELNGVYAISARNAWAVGGDIAPGFTGEQAIVLHWNGAKWLRVTVPGAGPDTQTGLGAVAASSAANVWAVGSSSTDDFRTSRALIFHQGAGPR